MLIIAIQCAQCAPSNLVKFVSFVSKYIYMYIECKSEKENSFSRFISLKVMDELTNGQGALYV